MTLCKRSVASKQCPSISRCSCARSLDRLSPAAKALVQIASAVGSGFSRSLLQSVCRFAPDDFEQAFVELVEDRFISASGAAQFMQYWFRHELLRDAVYQSMLRSTRLQLHKHIANTLCASHPEIAGQSA